MNYTLKPSTLSFIEMVLGFMQLLHIIDDQNGSYVGRNLKESLQCSFYSFEASDPREEAGRDEDE